MQLPQTLRTVHLYGHLAEGIGRKLDLCFSSPAEALRLIEVNFPGFLARFKEGLYHVSVVRNGREVDLEGDRLTLGFTGEALHIMPRAVGAKKGKGLLTALLGGLLIGAAFFLSGGALATALPGIFGITGATYGTLATMGVGLILQGIGILLTPTPKTDYQEDEKRSYIFNGPINVNEQGGVLPVIFGKMMVGTTVLSASLDVEMLEGTPFSFTSLNPSFVDRVRNPNGVSTIFEVDDLVDVPSGVTITHASLNSDPLQSITSFPTLAGNANLRVITSAGSAAQFTVRTATGNAAKPAPFDSLSAALDAMFAKQWSVSILWKSGNTNEAGYKNVLNLRFTNGTTTVDGKVTAVFGNHAEPPEANAVYDHTNDGNGNFTQFTVEEKGP